MIETQPKACYHPMEQLSMVKYYRQGTVVLVGAMSYMLGVLGPTPAEMVNRAFVQFNIQFTDKKKKYMNLF